LNGLAVLLHRGRERKNDIDAAHGLEFLSDVIFDDQNFVSSHFARVLNFAGGVRDRKDFVGHGFRDLKRDVPQPAESDYGNTLSALRPPRPVGAHRGKAAAEEWSGRLPWQIIGQQRTTVGFSDHEIRVAATVRDPGFGLRAEFDLFSLAIRASTASGLKPTHSDAISRSDRTDTGTDRIDFTDWFMT
jgi:hypothetical protein